MYVFFFFFFFFKQKTAYEMLRSLVGSEMCIRDSSYSDITDSSSGIRYADRIEEQVSRVAQACTWCGCLGCMLLGNHDQDDGRNRVDPNGTVNLGMESLVACMWTRMCWCGPSCMEHHGELTEGGPRLRHGHCVRQLSPVSPLIMPPMRSSCPSPALE
eukprot:TRINITY_DN1674_c0_g1_i10.p1 TRINITY_DN1674_c0_g1~~TRINITY_DN1674_c0_g1_i10.p1  ORF type:complete len:158 (-),score=34.36 TRINITY_DN1674_c0_g1_i10:239-712(-)